MAPLRQTYPLALLFLIGAGAIWLWQYRAVPRLTPFEAAIQRPIAILRVRGTADQVLAQFRQQTGVDVVVSDADRKRMNSPMEGNFHPRIDAILRDVNAASALNLIVQQFRDLEFTYAVDKTNRSLKIVNPRLLPMELRVYAVDDLLQLSRDIGAKYDEDANAATLLTGIVTMGTVALRPGEVCNGAISGNLLVVDRRDGHQRVEETLRMLREAVSEAATNSAPSAAEDFWLDKRRLSEVRIDSPTLARAVDAFGALAHVSIIMRQETDEPRVNFDQPAPVRLNLHDVTLRQALAALVAAEKGKLNIRLSCNGESITMDVTQNLRGWPWPHAHMVVYNVRDLVRRQQKLGRGYQESIAAITAAINHHLDAEAGHAMWAIDFAGLLYVGELPENHRIIAESLAHMRDTGIPPPP